MFEEDITPLTDDDLGGKQSFRERLDNAGSLENQRPISMKSRLRPSRWCAKQASGVMRHFDVQLIGGMVLHEGRSPR